MLLRLLCCLVTSAVSSCANSLIWRSFRIFVSSVLLHSKMKWPSESATVLLLQHGQPPASMLLPIWYLYGSRSFCWHTCRHVWNEPFRIVARWWKPAARFGQELKKKIFFLKLILNEQQSTSCGCSLCCGRCMRSVLLVAQFQTCSGCWGSHTAGHRLVTSRERQSVRLLQLNVYIKELKRHSFCVS